MASQGQVKQSKSGGSKKKIEAWKDGNFDNTMATDEIIRNYSRNKNLMLRYSPGHVWELGWYSAPDNNSKVPPTSGWKFNGGRCDPPNLGENIIIKQY